MKMLERVKSRIVVMRICCLDSALIARLDRWSDERLALPYSEEVSMAAERGRPGST